MYQYEWIFNSLKSYPVEIPGAILKDTASLSFTSLLSKISLLYSVPVHSLFCYFYCLPYLKDIATIKSPSRASGGDGAAPLKALYICLSCLKISFLLWNLIRRLENKILRITLKSDKENCKHIPRKLMEISLFKVCIATLDSHNIMCFK